MQTKKPKPILGTRAAYAAIHTNTKFGSDLICHFAEAVAPGFTGYTQNRIACRVAGDWDEDLQWKIQVISCFLGKNKRYWFFIHLALLWVAIKLTELHDPYKPTYGDFIKVTKERKQK